ncbi:MAG: response regulator transcription factor [Lachnospiraceae bacterium]|nr:response regulator transcription factor [Lachnospiraceae bacterium]
MKVLLAEDTADLNRAVSTMLTMSGFDVDSAFDGEEALAYTQSNGYDGIILDIMMPKKTGLEVLAALREANDPTPVLLLTAKSEVDDRVTGLDAGADDYLTKPFAMKELLARVRALTRRSSHIAKPEGELIFGDLHLFPETLEIRSESSIRLSAREFGLLHLLAGTGEAALPSEQILSRIWPGDEEAGTDTVWLYVSYLRTKLFSIGSAAAISGERGGSFTFLPGGTASMA